MLIMFKNKIDKYLVKAGSGVARGARGAMAPPPNFWQFFFFWNELMLLRGLNV